jgi:hypothetical protein
MSSTDEYGLCLNCGGHGATMRVTTDPEEPRLSRIGRIRIARGRNAFVFDPCTLCDGQDRVTPMQEARAEGGA